MIDRKSLFFASLILAVTAAAANAVSVTSAKKINLLHNATSSPFFTSNTLNTVSLAPFTTTDATSSVTFTPVGTVQAGQITSLTSNGSFSITGNSTSAGGWTDGNGVPAGITLTFNTQFTIALGAGSPANSFLTNPGTTGTQLGNGIGIAQGAGNIHTIDSANLTSPVGACCESLAVSAMSVSGVSFSGALTEPGFGFGPGTVGNFGPYVFNSNGFTEDGETLGLVSETGPPDPLNLGRPTIGFGVPSTAASENGRGDGIVASNVSIEPNFSDTLVSTRTGPHSTYFPRQIGAWTLTPQNGTIAIKGIGYEYDVNFAITPNVAGDYNKNGVVDAADYVLWRKGDLSADGTGNAIVDQADYDFWRARFGNVSGAGAGGGLSGASVPEPAALTLLVIGLLATCSGRRGKLPRTRTI